MHALVSPASGFKPGLESPYKMVGEWTEGAFGSALEQIQYRPPLFQPPNMAFIWIH